MPLYSIQCPKCHDTDDHFQGMDDTKVRVSCIKCGAYMTREKNRNYAADRISISGDTCSNSVDYSGFDEGLDTYVRSRDHRKEIMKERNLTEYVPNPEAKAARKEARYILDNAPKNDVNAKKEAKAQTIAFHKKRTKRVIHERMKKARKELNI